MTVHDTYPERYGRAKAQLGFAASAIQLAITRLKEGAIDAAASLLSVQLVVMEDELRQLDARDREHQESIIESAAQLERQVKAAADRVVALRKGPVLIVDNEKDSA